MRSSFVQRLKSQKEKTIPTRQSEQKSRQNKQKRKDVSTSQPKHHFKQDHADLKKLLSILSQGKNPESQQNIPRFAQKLESQYQLSLLQQTNKELNKNQSPNKFNSSFLNSSTQKADNHKTKSLVKKKNHNHLVHSEKRIRQNEQENQIQEFFVQKNTKDHQLYQFPTKRRPNAFSPLKFLHRHKQQSEKRQQSIPQKTLQKTEMPEKAKVLKKVSCQQKRGLQNIGNTCYINSVIQCLFHVPYFNQYFVKQSYLQQQNLEKLKINSDKGIVQKYKELYLYVMRGYLNSQEGNKSTYSLKFALSKACSLFLDWEQQDAHEFMRKMLDAMHQELNRAEKNTSYKLLKTKAKLQHSSIATLAQQYFQYYKKRDDSYIYDSLGGQIYNNVKCINCKNQSVSFDNCLDISLPIVKGKTSLQGLLEQYFGEQKLGDFYRCQYCNQVNKNSIKTTKFWKTPQILIIHLKRSQFGKKSQQPISFPLEILSLKDYMNSENDKIHQKHSNYALKGIVCHKGVLQGGHYWSMARQFGQWYRIDDQKVTKQSSDQMRQQYEVRGSSQPYILFYSSMNK